MTSTPPPRRGSRLERVRDDRPALYASRHVVLALAQKVLPVLGVGALLGAWFDVGRLRAWLRAPIDALRDAVSWLPDPLGWLVDPIRRWIGAIDLPAWAADIARGVRWWVPLMVAVVVAVLEVRRRRAASATGSDRAEA